MEDTLRSFPSFVETPEIGLWTTEIIHKPVMNTRIEVPMIVVKADKQNNTDFATINSAIRILMVRARMGHLALQWACPSMSQRKLPWDT